MVKMEAIEQELAEKSVERSDTIKEFIVEEKRKKQRTQAQKDAFEKARAKRKENLARRNRQKQKHRNK